MTAMPNQEPATPRIDLDLHGFAEARQQLAQLTRRQRALDLDIAKAQRAMAAATRAGASARATAALQARADQAQAERKALADERRTLQARRDALANDFIRERDPATLVASLDGRVPLALLPMRIETRYVGSPRQPKHLRIRIYPDDLNTIDHEPAPTASEKSAAMDYWMARFAHTDDEAARLQRDLITRCSRGRALWAIRVMTPINPLPAPDMPAEPQFPDLDTIDDLSKRTRAVLLPERWCAIGYAAGRREVFRVWGRSIPDELVLSPDWQATDDPQALLGGERAWMVDFDAALANGMAIEVTQADIAQHLRRSFDLASGTLERLIVVGFDWTRSAAESGIDFTDLLAAHRDSDSLGFAALGTPTNNTETRSAGYSPSTQRQMQEPAAEATNADPDALQLTQWAFGIPAGSLPADNIDNPHLSDQRTALHMMNALWRGTFGDYLTQMWNPVLDGDDKAMASTFYALRRYAVSYVRPTGALPILRVGKQPYAVLPLVGKRFVDAGDSPVETAVGKVLGVLRPIWELASTAVPQLTDGSMEVAKDILQTAPWSQTAFYRDKGVSLCMMRTPLGDALAYGPNHMIQSVLSALGPYRYDQVPIGQCNGFLPDPPYAAGQLAGVPWVLANAKDATREADDGTFLTLADDYLTTIAKAALQAPAVASAELEKCQAGPALLQALAAYSVQMEQSDAAEGVLADSGAVKQVLTRARTAMPYVEALTENEAIFTVQTPREMANLVIPAITGNATLGEHVAHTISAQLQPLEKSSAWTAAAGLYGSVQHLFKPTRDLGAVNLSLRFLATRSVGELNIAFRSTLDAFSYRLDAWLAARANRRLEKMRAAQPTGLHVGGYAWVENLKADASPDSEGYLLAPSQAHAATAALLRSGFMANHEQGAFDIVLDSKRVRRAQDILQGLTRDQPLAALYGYRIERGLRDGLLGKFIWPLRLAYPWRPLGSGPESDTSEAIGARDVVDGVALLADWGTSQDAVFSKLSGVLGTMTPPASAISVADHNAFATIIADALDLADSVSDLLLAEGAHQIAQGRPERAAAAMGVADKQALPVETQVGRTPRGGASYTQRIAVLCPDAAQGWPEDRRSRAEPAVNAWLASMLGAPTTYRFSARVHRADPHGHDAIDVDPVVATWDDLDVSPLSAVLLCDSAGTPLLSANGETGLRSLVATALIAKIDHPETVTGLDIQPTADDATTPGLAAFEAIAQTLKALLDKSRFATRKDLVQVDEAMEATLPPMGEYAGVDVAEIEARATALIDAFDATHAALLASPNADALLATLAAAADMLPPVMWPAQVSAIDAAGADPATREQRAVEAKDALTPLLTAMHEDLDTGPVLLDGQPAPTAAQRAQHAMARIKRLLGKNFPVLPRFAIGPYATEFNAALADQQTLTVADGWRVNGWLTQVARVREGADRLTAALSAHEALATPVGLGDLKVVQFPHQANPIWAALPEAWREDAAAAFDPKTVPEELRDYLAAQPGAAYRDIHRAAPKLAIAMHAPGIEAIAAEQTLAALVCDEWPEFIPDPFQTAAIGFQYDAPGARPPQAIVLALPPACDQPAWRFDDTLDVLHEAFDLAKLRGVRPKDLGSGLGALLPGNYLPNTYTNDLPSVKVLEMLRTARQRMVTAAATPILGKI